MFRVTFSGLGFWLFRVNDVQQNIDSHFGIFLFKVMGREGKVVNASL